MQGTAQRQDHREVTTASPATLSLRQINPSGKISLNPSGKSLLQIRLSHPARGAYRDRHERGMGCGGRGSVGRVWWFAGRFSVSGQRRAGRTALKRTAKSCGSDASMVGVKSCGGTKARPG